MRKTTIGYLSLASIMFNSIAFVLMCLTKQWFMSAAHLLLVLVSCEVIKKLFFIEEEK